MPVYIKKYRGANYFEERSFYDSLELSYIPSDGLPVFRFETEDETEPGTFRAGDFDLKISLLQEKRSMLGADIKEFFLGDERDFYFLVILKTGAQIFTGVARQQQITGNYTFSQNKWHVTLTCKDILIEWAKRCEASANASINFANGERLTFEEYIERHFTGLTSGIVTIKMPEKSYLERLRELYSNIQWCYALGDYRNFITGQQNISRWETFKELANGLGFNFDMYLTPGSELYSEPEFTFNIFFLSDLANEEAVEPEIIEISETITAPKPEWLYIKYRSIVLAEGEYSDGIFFNTNEQFGSDTNHGDGETLYPSLVLTMDGRSLAYLNSSGVTEKRILRDIDFRELKLKQYNYDLSTGRPIGKLFPLDEANGGGMAYARIFNCARVINGVGDLYDFQPIQETLIKNTSRFLHF